jgi:hypothetical protein
LIIFLINLISIKECTKYNSIYDFKDDNLLKTTLGNTIIKHFNYSHVFCNKSEDCYRLTITLNCHESFIDDIIAIRRYYNVDSYFWSHLSDFKMEKEFEEFYEFSYSRKTRIKKFVYSFIGKNTESLTLRFGDYWDSYAGSDKPANRKTCYRTNGFLVIRS